jgi:hypothetical protein
MGRVSAKINTPKAPKAKPRVICCGVGALGAGAATERGDGAADNPGVDVGVELDGDADADEFMHAV